MDDPHASVGLGLPHPDDAALEVYVAPMERAQLAETQAGEHEGREHRAAQAGPGAGLSVELACAVEQRGDVLCAVQPGPHRGDSG